MRTKDLMRWTCAKAKNSLIGIASVDAGITARSRASVSLTSCSVQCLLVWTLCVHEGSKPEHTITDEKALEFFCEATKSKMQNAWRDSNTRLTRMHCLFGNACSNIMTFAFVFLSNTLQNVGNSLGITKRHRSVSLASDSPSTWNDGILKWQQKESLKSHISKFTTTHPKRTTKLS